MKFGQLDCSWSFTVRLTYCCLQNAEWWNLPASIINYKSLLSMWNLASQILLWLFDIWQLEFNKTLSIGLSLYKTLWTLWTLASRIFCDCLASGGLSSTRRWSRQIRTIYSYGRKAEWWMTECCPAIIRYVNVLRLDHIHQNDILCKHLWYIAIKTKFGNKEREDMTWPFDTMTARVDGQMKDFQ